MLRRFLMLTVLSLWGIAVVGCAPVQHWTVTPSNALPPTQGGITIPPTYSDPNGAIFNPSFSGNPRPPDVLPTCDTQANACDGQPYADGARGFRKLICSVDKANFHGHVNWEVATLVGRASWESWNYDGDFNLYFQPQGGNGVTKSNDVIDGDSSRPYIELEFYQPETMDRMSTDAWTELQTAAQAWADEADPEAPDRVINPKHPGAPSLAVATGLFGLDCEHGCPSEVHPVYALGIETESDDPHADKWMIFARNWGTEGFCSNKNHVLDVGALRVMIPRIGAAAPKATILEFASTYRQAPVPTIEYHASYGVVVTFLLPPGKTSPLQELVLSLDWGEQSPAIAGTPGSSPSQPPKANAQPADADLYLKRAATDLDKGPRIELQNSVSVTAATHRSNELRTGFPQQVPVTTVTSFAPIPPPFAITSNQPRIDLGAINQSKTRGDAAALAALCERYKDVLPDRDLSASAAVCNDARKTLAK
ncbi:MAG TPA: hypothetical protein VGY48_05900 [Vicinamibacterales bacterium]|jgi:hypothetical protein|nr:hypothetical protein [Vicinamibacterales bacterium]